MSNQLVNLLFIVVKLNETCAALVYVLNKEVPINSPILLLNDFYQLIVALLMLGQNRVYIIISLR